jgi:hypothetical protein
MEAGAKGGSSERSCSESSGSGMSSNAAMGWGGGELGAIGVLAAGASNPLEVVDVDCAALEGAAGSSADEGSV